MHGSLLECSFGLFLMPFLSLCSQACSSGPQESDKLMEPLVFGSWDFQVVPSAG